MLPACIPVYIPVLYKVTCLYVNSLYPGRYRGTPAQVYD